MDAIVPDGFSSSYNRKSRKCQRDAIQAQLEKEHKLIDKGGNVSAREMGKDQERVRKCLERLEHDRVKFCKDYEPGRGNSPFPNTDERDRSHSRSSCRPLSGYDVKSQSRSRRQLQEAGATSMDLKRPTSRRSLDQGKGSADSGHDHPQGRQLSNSVSLSSPGKKKSHGLKGATSAVDKRLPDTPIPSIVLTEEDCKQSSILFLSPTAKPNADILNNKQAPEKAGANKENRVPPNQDHHPSRSGYREHNPSPRENTKHDSQSRDHHVKRAYQEDQQHGARAKHGHDHAGSHDHHHPHGSRPILRDHHDSQSGLPSHRDSRHGVHHAAHHAAHHSHLHKESRRQSHILENRRSSQVGHDRKLAHENNMEEAQNLYELAIQSVADAHKHSPPTIHGRRGSVSGERRGSLPGERKGSVSLEKHSPLALPEHMPNLNMLDSSAMEDLEELLREVQIYRDRKIAEEEQGFCYMQSRAQRRRLEHIESILEKLSRHSTTKFDPKEMLACGYLRLSKYNVEALENMMREAGEDPGIHAHSDVTDYDLWADIRREKELEKASADVTSLSPLKKIKG